MKEIPSDKNHALWGKLCDREKNIFDLKKEIADMESFISTISGSENDRRGLERSLNMDLYKTELKRFEEERDMLAKALDKMERAKLGQEIPRTRSGKLQIPWDEINRLKVQKGVEDILKVEE